MEASCRLREGPTPFWFIPLLIQGGRKAQELIVSVCGALLCLRAQLFFPSLPPSQIPYRLKETDNEFDSFSQVPESPIGREEEPHLYMVAKKYRKVVAFWGTVVGLAGTPQAGPKQLPVSPWGAPRRFTGVPWCGKAPVQRVVSLLRSRSNTPSWGWKTLTSSITTRLCLQAWSPISPTPTATA